MIQASRRASGFTLIELMIVVAMIGILAAIAVPTYSNYVARAQFSEALTLVSGVKTAVADAYQSRDDLDGIDNGVGSIPAASAITGTYVENVVVTDGIITATFKADSALDGKTMTLIPTINKDALAWQCTTTAPPAKAPSTCNEATPNNLGSDTVPITD